MEHQGNKTHCQAAKTLPFAYYFIPFLIIALIGIVDSLYLVVSHYRVHSDLSYSSFCALSRAFNCDTVSSSPYAVFLNVTIALWGVIGYLPVLGILILAGSFQTEKKRLWPLLFWISLSYSIISLILAGISSLVIHSYCIMCIISYGVNLLLVYYAWFLNRRFGDAGLFKGLRLDIDYLWRFKAFSIPSFVLFLFIVGGLITGMPNYWEIKPPPIMDSIPTGVTEDGHPWVGAENPSLTIVEFSDYMCFQCRKMHYLLRQLIAQHPEKIRLIHRHFPMDRQYNPLVVDDYHNGAGKMAIIALYAQAKGQFWKVNDLLFDIAGQKQDFNSKTIAEFMDVDRTEIVAALDHGFFRLQLKHDIAVGIDKGMTGTPGFIINGSLYTGTIPPHFLQKVKDE